MTEESNDSEVGEREKSLDRNRSEQKTGKEPQFVPPELPPKQPQDREPDQAQSGGSVQQSSILVIVRGLYSRFLAKTKKLPVKLVISLISLTAALIVSFWTVKATFHFVGQTELAQLVLDATPVYWHFTNALVYKGHGSKGQKFSGIYHPAPNMDVLVERISLGPLRIRCKDSSGGGAGELTLDSDNSDSFSEKISENSVVFLIDDPMQSAKEGDSIVLPFSGRIAVGTNGGVSVESSTPMTRSAEIRILGHSLFDRTIYDGGTVALSPGDSIPMSKLDAHQSGIISIDERPAINVVFGEVGFAQPVNRFRSEGYEAKTTLVNRIKGDAAVQAVWILFGSISGFLIWARSDSDAASGVKNDSDH